MTSGPRAPTSQAGDKQGTPARVLETHAPEREQIDEPDLRSLMGNRALATLLASGSPEGPPANGGVQRAANNSGNTTPRHRHPHTTPPRHLRNLPLESIVALQRSTGNRAVTDALSVQRCGPVPCDCPTEEQQRHESSTVPDLGGHAPETRGDQADAAPVQRAATTATPLQPAATTATPLQRAVATAAPVQRGAATATPLQRAAAVPTVQRGVAEALLPDWMLNLAKRGTSKVKGFAGKLKRKGKSLWNRGKAKFKSVAAKFKAGGSKLWSKGKQLAADAKAKATGKVKGWVTTGKAAVREGLAAAKRIARSGKVTGPLINPMLPFSPDDLTEGIAHVNDVVSSIPGGVAGFGDDVAKAVKDGANTGEWQCDDTQIVAIAGGVKKAVVDNARKAAKKVLGEDRYQRAAEKIDQTIATLRQVASQIKAGAARVKQAVSAWWTRTVAPIKSGLKKVGTAIEKKWAKLKGKVKKGWNELKGEASKAWNKVKKTVGEAATKAADAIKSTALNVYNNAKGAIGSLWDKLPSWLRGGLKVVGAGLVAPIAAPFYAVYKVGQKVGGFVADHKDEIIATVKEGLDALTKGLAKTYNAVKGVVQQGLQKAKEWASAIGGAIKRGLASAYRTIDGWTGGRITGLREALAAQGPKLKGEVCELLGDVAGPCIEQFVPDPAGAEGTKGFGELKLNGEITVPIGGVPVKVGAGSTIKIEREGSGKQSTYKVTIQGDGVLAVSAAASQGAGGGGTTAKLDVSLPKGLAFEKVTGKSLGVKAHGLPVAGGEDLNPTPAGGNGNAPAPTGTGAAAPASTNGQSPAGGPAAPGAAGGPSAGAAVEAGIKGSIAMVYKFDASKDESTCDGLGGMAGLLASYGVASALPAPFDAIGTNLAQGAFQGQLQSAKFTLMEYGKATFDLAGGNAVGDIKATIAAERGIEYETKKKGDDTIHSATLKAGASGELAAAFKVGPLAGFGAKAGTTATVSVGLSYSEKEDRVTSSSAEAKLGAKFALTEAQKALTLVPSVVRGQVQSELSSFLPEGQSTTGEISIEAALKVDKLHVLGAKIDDYFADPDTVTSDGLWTIVNEHLASNYTQMLTVKAKQTSKDEAKVGVAAEAKGKGGVKGGLTIARGIERERTLYGPAPI